MECKYFVNYKEISVVHDFIIIIIIIIFIGILLMEEGKFVCGNWYFIVDKCGIANTKGSECGV